MKDLYGAQGLYRFSALLGCIAAAFGSVTVWAILMVQRGDADGSGARWITSAPLFVAPIACALSLGLLWSALSGGVARLDFSLWVVGRWVVYPLLALSAAGFTLTHLFYLLERDGRFPRSFGVVASPALVAGSAGLLVSLLYGGMSARLFLQRRRGLARLRRLFRSFSERYSPSELERIEAFVRQETGRGGGPSLLIRGAVFPGLSSRPWHDPASLPWMAQLTGAFAAIREEALSMMQAGAELKPYFYPGIGGKTWRTLMFYSFGKRIEDSCARCPEIARAIESIPGASLREAMLSVLEPGGRIAPHRDRGNVFLTCHLGISIPPSCSLTVGGLTRSWKEGECLIFDTSYEHEAVNDSAEPRIVLLLDFWHPELTAVERELLSAP